MDRKDLLKRYQDVVREQQDFVSTAKDSGNVNFKTDESYVKRSKEISDLTLFLQEAKELEERASAFDHQAQTRSNGRSNTQEDAKEIETRNFVNYIRTADTNLMTQSRSNLASNGTTTGGYLVPTFVSAQVIQDLAAFETVRKLGAEVQTVNGNENLPIFNDATANFIQEAQTITATDPTTGRVQITPNLLVCKTTYSWQLANRSAANVVDQIRASFVRGIAKKEAAKFLYGGGSNEPQGLVAGGTQGGATTASATTFTSVELLAPFYAMNPQLSATGTWIMSPAAAQIARGLESTNGAALWYPNLSTGNETLLGRPVVIDANMDAVSATNKPVVFANVPEAYVIGEEVGLQVLSDPYTAAGTGEIKLFVYKFVDGRVKKATAAYYMLMHA